MQCGIRETRYNRSIATYSAFFFPYAPFFFTHLVAEDAKTSSYTY